LTNTAEDISSIALMYVDFRYVYLEAGSWKTLTAQSTLFVFIRSKYRHCTGQDSKETAS